jgi:hypothetical protein
MSLYLSWSVATHERLCDAVDVGDWVELGTSLKARTNAELADLVEEHMQLDLPMLTPAWAFLDEVIDRLRR